MIIGDGDYGSKDCRIARLEMDLSTSREEVYRLKKALDNMAETNEKLSAEISELRHRCRVQSDEVTIDYIVI